MTTGTAGGRTLAELSDEERNERFDHLQERMRGVWEIMRRNEEGESVVVIPSVSVDRVSERSGSLQQAYEERFLVLLLLLRHPRQRGPMSQGHWSNLTKACLARATRWLTCTT